MIRSQIPVISHVFRTQLGWISISWREEKVCQLSFGHPDKAQALRRLHAQPSSAKDLTTEQSSLVGRLKDYAEGAPDSFRDVSVDLENATQFQRRVYAHCRKIPSGTTASYKTLAERAGSPRAARAVGNAMAGNPIPLIVPCHRVVASGSAGLGGFSAPGGRTMKQRLLDMEQPAAAKAALSRRMNTPVLIT